MTLSQRERYIAIAAAVVLGLLAFDRFALGPWLTMRADVATRLEAARADAERTEQVFDNQRRANRRWAELARDTLKTDASAAEGQLLNAMRDWAQASGLALTAVRPDRGSTTSGFGRITVRATGTGGMDQVARFLWDLQTAAVPVRIGEMQIASRKPGADELTLQLSVSTIFLPHADTGEGAQP